MEAKLLDISSKEKATSLYHTGCVIQDGWYGYLKSNKEGTKLDFEPCGSAVIVTRVFIDIDTGENFLELQYCTPNGKEMNLIVSRSTLVEAEIVKWAMYGVQVRRKTASILLQCIENQERKAVTTYRYSKTGFTEFAGQLVFKGYKIPHYNSEYCGKIAITPQGSLEAWKQMIQSEVLGTPMEIILVGALSAPVIDYLKELYPVDNIVFSLVGDSSSGKTTALYLAVSAGAKPSASDESLMLSFLDTENSIMHKLSSASAFPVGIDEASTYNRNSTKLLYSIANGKERSRMRKDLSTVDSAEFHNSVFMSSEKSILSMADNNSGLQVRVMEFSNISWTKSAESADKIKKVCLANYGWGVQMMAEHLLKQDEREVIKRCEQMSEEFLAERKNETSSLVIRMAKKVGILLATAEMTKDIFGLQIKTEKIKKFFLEQLMVDQNDYDIGIKAYETVLAYYTENPIEFGVMLVDNSYIPSDQFYRNGRVETLKNCVKLYDGSYAKDVLYIKKETFEKVLNSNGFTDSKVVLRRMKELNLLISEKDRYISSFKLGAKNVVIKGYKILIRTQGQTVEKEDTKYSIEDASENSDDIKSSNPFLDDEIGEYDDEALEFDDNELVLNDKEENND